MRTEREYNMSLFDSLVAAIIKADKENTQPQPQPQPQPQEQPQPQPEPQPQPQPQKEPQPEPIDYKAEYEKLFAQNITLQKQLGESQQTNLNLLNMTPVNDTKSFSQIMRGQEYHPLYERNKK